MQLTTLVHLLRNAKILIKWQKLTKHLLITVGRIQRKINVSIGAHHRDAVIETVLRDRPYADVAAELGVAPGTLRTRVHYGLRRLRCALETADAAA